VAPECAAFFSRSQWRRPLDSFTISAWLAALVWCAFRCSADGSGCGEAEKKKGRPLAIMLGSATMPVRPVEVASGLGSTACDWCFLIAFDGRCEVVSPGLVACDF